MWKWVSRKFKRNRSAIAKICLLLVVCVCVLLHLQSKATPSVSRESERQNASYKTLTSTGYLIKNSPLSGIRRRQHARFRQKRFVGIQRAKLSKKSGALTSRQGGFLGNITRKESGTQIITTKHVIPAHKSFAEVRNKDLLLGTTILTKREDETQTKSPSRTRTKSNSSDTHTKIFAEWQNEKQTACGKLLELYHGQFISLRSSIFRKSRVWCQNQGGEDIEQVKWQNEETEYYTIHHGFFATPCKDNLAELRLPDHQGHLIKWLDNIRPLSLPRNVADEFRANFTIIVKRYEYVNIYHTMTDFYNAFLVMSFFKKSPKETSIIFFDAHPKGNLDIVWRTLFGTVLRVSQLSNITQFRHVVWGIPSSDSMLSEFYTHKSIPLLEQFRAFFLKRHGVINKHSLDCKRGLRLVIIFRRDYVAHPRNPDGKVERKISNENQLLKVANNTGLFSSIFGLQLDQLSMREQLMHISSTDILVGMHGAGLTHAIFLPEHAGVVELVPEYFPKLNHFFNISKWRHLKYLRWQNLNSRHEMSGKRTRIPPSVFRTLLFKMRKKLCH